MNTRKTFLYCLRAAGFAILLLFVASSNSHGQEAPTLVVWSYGQINDGALLNIDKTPEMPPLTLTLSSACPGTCSVHYDVAVDWIASGGQQTFGEISGDFGCNDSASIDWSFTGFVGGEGTITWSINNGQDGGGTFSFDIVGENPDPDQIDQLTPSPWFFQNIISEESGYRQFNSVYPFVGNNPNGVGLTQLDPPFSNDDFWNWQTNIFDGHGVLAAKQSAAYDFWNRQVDQMQADTAPNYVYPTRAPYPYCAFSYPQQSGDQSYADAEWIHSNNGGYMISWLRPSGGVPGAWSIEFIGYISFVCTSAPQ